MTRPEERPKNPVAQIAEPALWLAALAGTLYLWGDAYYDGFFGYFGIRSYLLGVSTERLAADAWPELPVAFMVGFGIWTLEGFVQRPLSRRILVALPLIGMTVWALVIHSSASEVGLASSAGLVIACIWFALAVLAFTVPPGEKHPLSSESRLGSALRVGLLIFFIAFPPVILAHTSGEVYAMKATRMSSDNALPEVRLIGRSGESIAFGRPDPRLLVLQHGGWLATVAAVTGKNPIPHPPEVVFTPASEVLHYITSPAPAADPDASKSDGAGAQPEQGPK